MNDGKTAEHLRGLKIGMLLGARCMRLDNRRQWPWQVMMLVTMLGCNRSGLEKVVVAGDVTYNGQPVSNGEILFYPTGATQGPVSGASIKDGHFEAIGKGGVPVGTHRVVIRGFRAARTDSRTAAVAASVGMEGGIREQYLPAKFNEKSTLEATIDGDQNHVVKDFQLAD